MDSPGFFESIGRTLSGPGMFGGKFQLRLIIQPLIAIILGFRFGIRDAKAGKEPFAQAVAHAKGGRGALIAGAARNAIVPLTVALVLDSILQYMINQRIRPLAALIVGGILVFVPFIIVRGLANRVWKHGHPSGPRPVGKAP